MATKTTTTTTTTTSRWVDAVGAALVYTLLELVCRVLSSVRGLSCLFNEGWGRALKSCRSSLVHCVCVRWVVGERAEGGRCRRGIEVWSTRRTDQRVAHTCFDGKESSADTAGVRGLGAADSSGQQRLSGTHGIPSTTQTPLCLIRTEPGREPLRLVSQLLQSGEAAGSSVDGDQTNVGRSIGGRVLCGRERRGARRWVERPSLAMLTIG
ncbi:hypothetical protein IWZ03DRAFT_100918 [Phyllosticta citriasiana]|uniref:Uncharacterized protein n=1 Tax=Phyllosticta citriasiana TaxID=595635 RepID=A0ABR1KYW4_9PEZI